MPDGLYRRLKIRAAESGVTLREIVLHGIERERAGDRTEVTNELVNRLRTGIDLEGVRYS